MAAYEVLLLNTAIPQIQAAQSGDTYVVPRDIAFSTVANLANGTNLLPSLTFSSDTNTGIYREGADALGFTAGGGTNQMVLTSTGLGIGTNNPALKLHVVGASGSGDVQIGTNAGANQYQYITFGGSNGGTDFGWQIGRSSNTSGIGGNGALYFYDIKANANRMSIDSSGNLGLGVTPSAWGSGYKALQINNGGLVTNVGGTFTAVTANAYFDGSSYKYVSTAVASLYRQNAGVHDWQTAPSGTANSTTIVSGNQYTIVTAGGNFTAFGAANNNVGTVFTATSSGTATGGAATQTIVFTQAMTLDASGNLLVGATSSSSGITLERSGATSAEIKLNQTGASGRDYRIASTGSGYGSAGNLIFYDATASAERARITSGGNLLVGATDNILASNRKLQVEGAAGATLVATGTGGEPCAELWQKATSGDNKFLDFFTETSITARGSITYNRTAGLVAYNTTSDYRAKDILGPVANSGATIDALKVYEGKMKGATQSRPMLVAHEAQEVAPYAVTGEKDAVNEDGTPKYQQMDVSSLVPLLLAEIQSLRARVAQLEAK